MSVKTLEDLFTEELRDLYDAEKQIGRALPWMVEKAVSKNLETELQSHLWLTEDHISRLEQAFSQLGEDSERRGCEAMKGIIEEGRKLVGKCDVTVRDSALIAAAQKMEHYEIATYGTLREWALLLGHEEVVVLLQKTLEEEGKSDKRLTDIASRINLQAAQLQGHQGHQEA